TRGGRCGGRDAVIADFGFRIADLRMSYHVGSSLLTLKFTPRYRHLSWFLTGLLVAGATILLARRLGGQLVEPLDAVVLLALVFAGCSTALLTYAWNAIIVQKVATANLSLNVSTIS